MKNETSFPSFTFTLLKGKSTSAASLDVRSKCLTSECSNQCGQKRMEVAGMVIALLTAISCSHRNRFLRLRT